MRPSNRQSTGCQGFRTRQHRCAAGIAAFSALTALLSASMFRPGAAIAANAATEFEYARVFTARVVVQDGQDETELAQIARVKGTSELITMPAGGSPTQPHSRVVERWGDPGYGYPGFTVSAHNMFESGSAGTRGAPAQPQVQTFNIAGHQLDVQLATHGQTDNRTTIVYSVTGQEIIRTSVCC